MASHYNGQNNKKLKIPYIIKIKKVSFQYSFKAG